MKYFVLETTMHADAYKQAGFREALGGHMQFVKAQFTAGQILFSGTKPNNSGGVRVLKIADDANVDEFWKQDPMYAAGLMDYRVTPFTSLDVSEGAQGWFA